MYIIIYTYCKNNLITVSLLFFFDNPSYLLVPIKSQVIEKNVL